jgi:hypothetical protein
MTVAFQILELNYYLRYMESHCRKMISGIYVEDDAKEVIFARLG